MTRTGTADPMVGTTLDDQYRLDELLGEGGMGRVYRADQLAVSRDVAVKILHENLARDDTIVNRFLREAEVISDFSHPNIVNLVDFGTDSDHGVAYLVMEMLDGMELDTLLESYRFEPPLAVEIIEQACAALTEPHGEGVVHRDLKPGNLMIQRIADGSIQIKILDFGIAHVVQAQTQITKTDAVCGTPSYMAPEQARATDVSVSSDLYALGVIFFELLTGELPITGDSSFEVMLKHIESEAPRVTECRDGMPKGLSKLVGEMLAKAPENRPGDANVVRDRLEEIRSNEDYSRIRVDPDLPLREGLRSWLEPTGSLYEESHVSEDYDAESLADLRERVAARVEDGEDEGGETDVGEKATVEARPRAAQEGADSEESNAVGARADGKVADAPTTGREPREVDADGAQAPADRSDSARTAAASAESVESDSETGGVNRSTLGLLVGGLFVALLGGLAVVSGIGESSAPSPEAAEASSRDSPTGNGPSSGGTQASAGVAGDSVDSETTVSANPDTSTVDTSSRSDTGESGETGARDEIAGGGDKPAEGQPGAAAGGEPAGTGAPSESAEAGESAGGRAAGGGDAPPSTDSDSEPGAEGSSGESTSTGSPAPQADESSPQADKSSPETGKSSPKADESSPETDEGTGPGSKSAGAGESESKEESDDGVEAIPVAP